MLEFLGIGAQKAGTSWLTANLRRHSRLFLPAVKELHFWDRHRDRGLDWYRAQFADLPKGVLGGEVTPAYAILDPAVIAEVKREFPDIRLIYLMRNPMERAWSAALMGLGRAEMEVGEASERWFIDHFESKGSRRRGDYETCLRNWFQAYGRERVLVMLFDHIMQDPRAVLLRCARHLEIESTPFETASEAELRQAVNAGSGHPLPDTLRDYLARRYEPQICSLEDFLGMDLGCWRVSPSPSLARRLAGLIGRSRP